MFSLRVLTVVAAELRCSRAHVHNLINGKVRDVPALPSLQLGRRRLVQRTSLSQWISSNERGIGLSDHRRKLTPRTHERDLILRRRYEEGSLKKVDGKWIAQWWEDGHRRKRTLGSISSVPKAEGRTELDEVLAPINSEADAPSPARKWDEFVNGTYLPFYKRKGKRSSAMTNEHRLRVHLGPIYSERTLGSLNRDELQTMLDQKAASGLSYSVVAHLRWDLRQILRMAVSEGHILRNPADLLFIPRKPSDQSTRPWAYRRYKNASRHLNSVNG